MGEKSGTIVGLHAETGVEVEQPGPGQWAEYRKRKLSNAISNGSEVEDVRSLCGSD
jgi:hypothetical protein